MQSPTLEEDDELSYFEESLQTIFDDVKGQHEHVETINIDR